MSRAAQDIRFCTSRDGVRIAYATCGEGPPLVRAGHIVTHLEADWDCLVWRPLLEELSHRHTLVRYDLRGCGLSDREGVEFSFDKFVEDLDAVIEAVGLERCALLGVSGGGAPAVAYAVAHPEKVSHLILYGAFTRGRIARSTTNEEREESETLLRLIEHGWNKEDPSFRQLFAS
jgi:pimeloyl-ACP methyl ester carboxylesterase